MIREIFFCFLLNVYVQHTGPWGKYIHGEKKRICSRLVGARWR